MGESAKSSGSCWQRFCWSVSCFKMGDTPSTLNHEECDTTKYEFPKTIDGFGYHFVDDKLLSIKDGRPFDYQVSEDMEYNQKHYEKLGEIITEFVYEQMLSSELGLLRVDVIPEDERKRREKCQGCNEKDQGELKIQGQNVGQCDNELEMEGQNVGQGNKEPANVDQSNTEQSGQIPEEMNENKEPLDSQVIAEGHSENQGDNGGHLEGQEVGEGHLKGQPDDQQQQDLLAESKDEDKQDQSEAAENTDAEIPEQTSDTKNDDQQPIVSPIQSEPDRYGFIFISKDALICDKLLILVHGSGVVRAGQWARRLIINEDLDKGTQFPYIKRAKEEGYGVIVLNTNENFYTDSNGKKAYYKGSRSPEDHIYSVWKQYISKAAAKHIAFVAHSYGGICVMELCIKLELESISLDRIFAIALTDSVHSFWHQQSQQVVEDHFKKVACNWVSSDLPLDKEIDYGYGREDCKLVSAGHEKHEWTSYSAFDSVFKYLKEKYQQRTKEMEENDEQTGQKDMDQV